MLYVKLFQISNNTLKWLYTMNKWDLFLECKRQFNLWISSNVLYHSNKMKGKTTLSSPLIQKKPLTKFSAISSFKEKKIILTRYKRELLQDIDHIWKNYSQHHTQRYKTESIPSKTRAKTRMPAFTTSIQQRIGSSSWSN